MIVYKFLVLDRSTWNRIIVDKNYYYHQSGIVTDNNMIVYKFLALYRNTSNPITGQTNNYYYQVGIVFKS